MERIFRLVLVALPCAFILSSCSLDKTSPVNPSQAGQAQQSATAAASANGMTHTDAPFTGSFYVPCANGGAGEIVDVSGIISIDQQLLDQKDGCQKFNFHVSLKQATGTGETSGTTYTVQYRENAQEFIEWVCSDACPSTVKATLNFGLRGKGAAENYTIHENLRYLINCDWSITVLVDNFNVTCN